MGQVLTTAEAAVGESTPEGRPGVFLAALTAHRQSVLAALATVPELPRLSRLIFDLASHLAMDAEAALDDALFDAFARRHGLDEERSEVRLPQALGGERSLRQILTEPRVPVPASEALSALFALGYRDRLEPLDVVERRNFTLRVVNMLPGIERFGTYVLSDFMDAVCDEEDALRFWQIYVDRVAAEISRRGGPPESTVREPWLLSRLLALQAEGPVAPRGTWLALTRHVERILQAQRHRWRFIRHLAEGCHEPRMLLYLSMSPAMVEDPEVLPIFLTRGNGRLVSCALMALSIHPTANDAVERALAQLEDRSFAEIGGRLVEIMGQLSLFPAMTTGGALRTLNDGLLDQARRRLGEAPLDLLPNALASDGRAFRQSQVLVELEPALREAAPAYAFQFLERVVAVWASSFTPSGIEHPLNDAIFREGVRRAWLGLLLADADEGIGRAETLGAELPGAAIQWSGGDALLAQHLAGRFGALFGTVWLAVCRSLGSDERAAAVREAAYVALVRLYGRLGGPSRGSGGFGALDAIIPALFPELAETTSGDAGRVLAAARLAASMEDSVVVQPDATSLMRVPACSPAGQDPPPPIPHTLPLFGRLPTREEPIVARALVDLRPTGRVVALLRMVTGWEAAAAAVGAVRFALGRRASGRVVLTGQELIARSAARQGASGTAAVAVTWSLGQIESVRVEGRFSVLPRVLGSLFLASGALLGGRLAFAGLRADEPGTVGWAGLCIALGLVADTALRRLSQENARSFLVEIRAVGRGQSLRLIVDAQEGAGLLDAFMAYDAARRELENLRRGKGREGTGAG